MKYAVKIKNQLKGMKEIAIFNTKKEAEDCFNILEELWNVNEFSEELMTIAYNEAFDKSISYLDYWDAKNLNFDYTTIELKNVKYKINNNGKVTSEISNIKFVFGGKIVEIPA